MTTYAHTYIYICILMYVHIILHTYVRMYPLWAQRSVHYRAQIQLCSLALKSTNDFFHTMFTFHYRYFLNIVHMCIFTTYFKYLNITQSNIIVNFWFFISALMHMYVCIKDEQRWFLTFKLSLIFNFKRSNV